MSFLKFGLVLSLLIISKLGFATIVIPSPSNPITEKTSREFKELQKAKDYKNLREHTIKQAYKYHDLYVSEFKRMNNTSIDPFDKSIREEIPLNLHKMPDSFFDNTENDLFKIQQIALSDILKKKMNLDQVKDESDSGKQSITNQGSLLYLLILVAFSIVFYFYQKKSK